MKKIILLLGIIVSVGLVGCGEETADLPSESENAEEISAQDDDAGVEEPEEVEEDEIPIHPDSISAEINILEPDSIGTVYMEATYTNNSEYPITGYDMTVLLKDTNEKTYLSNYDTIMPGETSPKFESFGPETQDENDYEILMLEVQARTEEGNTLYIDYDFKLEEASWWEASSD